MPKSIRRANLVRRAGGAAALIMCAVLNIILVLLQYSLQGNSASVQQYIDNLSFTLLILFIFQQIWWTLFTTEFLALSGLRSFSEQHSFLISLGFALFSFLFAGIQYVRCHAILLQGSEQSYLLSCVFELPLVLTCMMFACPPVNVSQVLLPGRGILYAILRFAVSGILLGLAVRLFAINFFL
ncbi:MAG: hypothetical protein IJT94_14870 [Oscillibacter sp.]|nr:hypothetical protein [Oscillibacter sp.]